MYILILKAILVNISRKITQVLSRYLRKIQLQEIFLFMYKSPPGPTCNVQPVVNDIPTHTKKLFVVKLF